jgi:hypothetical protein
MKTAAEDFNRSGHNEGKAKTYARRGCSADDNHMRRGSHSLQEKENTYFIDDSYSSPIPIAISNGGQYLIFKM